VESPVPILFQTVLDDVIQRRRDVAARLRQLGRFLHQDRRHRLGVGVPAESHLSREQLVEDCAERKDVRSMVDGKPLDLLRRHVARGPHDDTGLGVLRAGRGAGLRIGARRLLDPLGQPEIQDLDAPVLRDDEVLGLEVPMDDPSVVRGREATRDLEAPVDGLLLRDGTGEELRAQRVAFEKLGDRVSDALVSAEVVNREDVRMRQRRDGLRLSLEARQRIGVVATAAGSTLIATSRSSFESRARYTSPIPPAPRGDRTS
jgi:hypothetical protein